MPLRKFILGNKIPKLDPEYEENIKQVLETAGRVKGTEFEKSVKFMLNVQTLIGMCTEIGPLLIDATKKDKESIAEVISQVANSMTDMYTNAIGLKKDDHDELINTVRTVTELIEKLQGSLNG